VGLVPRFETDRVVVAEYVISPWLARPVQPSVVRRSQRAQARTAQGPKGAAPEIRRTRTTHRALRGEKRNGDALSRP